MKRCHYCAEKIQKDAIKCRFCGEWLSKTPESSVGIKRPVPDAAQPKKEAPESSDLNETANAQILPDNKEQLAVEDEILDLYDDQVNAFRDKFGSMTIGELLKIRDSFVPRDYTPEARYLLNELFSKRKDDLDIERAALDEDEKPSKRKTRSSNFTLGDIYSYLVLVFTSIGGVFVALSVILEILDGLRSIGATEIILLLIILPMICLWFIVAIGLLKRKKIAYTINFVLLTIGLIGNIIALLLGRAAIQQLPYFVWCGGWLIYFSRIKRRFDR